MKVWRQIIFVFFCLVSPGMGLCQEGAWDTLKPDAPQERPKLKWELLKGYRLFFHPEDREATRRSLILAMPTGYHMRTAYLLIRPQPAKGTTPRPWLRVEGTTFLNQVKFDWDGCYQNQEFPDGAYEVDLNLFYQGGGSEKVGLVVLKTKDHPRFFKVGNRQFTKQVFHFVDGEYVPEEAGLSLSKTEFSSAPVVGEVYLPALPGEFSAAGVMLSCRPVIQVENKPEDYGPWDCFCKQAVPADSPARTRLKKVACDWDLRGVEPGLYDVKISIWHEPKRVNLPDPCDVPILDSENIRVQIVP